MTIACEVYDRQYTARLILDLGDTKPHDNKAHSFVFFERLRCVCSGPEIEVEEFGVVDKATSMSVSGIALIVASGRRPARLEMAQGAGSFKS